MHNNGTRMEGKKMKKEMEERYLIKTNIDR